MSFDIYFQGFTAGEVDEQGGNEMRRVLMPYAEQKGPSFWHIRYGDGEADVHVSDEAMMANHVSGRDPWDLLVRAAREADWVIMPSDGPTCLTRDSQRQEIPVELAEDVILVESGGDLLQAIDVE